MHAGERQRERLAEAFPCQSRTQEPAAGNQRDEQRLGPRRRNEGKAPLAILAEQAEIGRRIADAEHTQVFRVRPSFANAAIDELPRHDAKAPRIEIAQVNNVHDTNLTRRYALRRAEYCIAPEALTPYFSTGLR